MRGRRRAASPMDAVSRLFLTLIVAQCLLPCNAYVPTGLEPATNDSVFINWAWTLVGVGVGTMIGKACDVMVGIGVVP